MKKLLLLIVCFFSVCAVNASTTVDFNMANAQVQTNRYIRSFNNYNLYLVDYSSSYIKYKFVNGVLSTDIRYTYGGMLNKDEFVIAGGNNSYLSDGQSYWTMTDANTGSSYEINSIYGGFGATLNTVSSGVRVAQYINTNVSVTGKGTYSEPWEFVPVNQSVSYQILPSITGAFTTVSGNANYGTDKSLTVNLNNGFEALSSITCDKSEVSSSLSNSNKTVNIVLKNITDTTKCTVSVKKTTASITLNVYNGSGSGINTVYIGQPLTVNVSPNAGYSLATSANCTNGVVGYMSGSQFKINAVNANATCNVFMVQTPYALNLNGNGGSSWYPYRYIYYGGQYGSLPTPSINSCYTFLGWYTSTSGGTRIYDSSYYYGTGATTLYAQWSYNSYGGSWGSCSYSYVSGSYAYGTQYNSCGASSSCSTYCPYSYSYYDQGNCGNQYYVYSCGMSQYVGYYSCYVAPYCSVSIMNPYPTCARAGDFEFSAWCNVNINSCSWGGCKSGGGGWAYGQDCYPNCLVGVYPRNTWCYRWNTLTAYLNTVSGSTSCSGSYYPS